VIIGLIMDTKPSPRAQKLSALVCLLALSGLSFVIASGCSRSEAAPSRDSSPEAAAPAKGPKVDAEAYTVEMKATGTYKAGQEGLVELTIVPKGEYHINGQYPFKLKMKDPAPEGLTFPKPILKKEDGTFDDKKGAFKVPFVSAKAGKAMVSGTLSLSVCSSAHCLMQKEELELEVGVDGK
jgi:hypothetical protein